LARETTVSSTLSVSFDIYTYYIKGQIRTGAPRQSQAILNRFPPLLSHFRATERSPQRLAATLVPMPSHTLFNDPVHPWLRFAKFNKASLARTKLCLMRHLLQKDSRPTATQQPVTNNRFRRI